MVVGVGYQSRTKQVLDWMLRNDTAPREPRATPSIRATPRQKEQSGMRKILISLATAAVVAASLVGTSANAANADQFVQNGDFGNAASNALAAGSTTAYTPANLLDHPANYGDRNTGSMYDEGTYTLASNPA